MTTTIGTTPEPTWYSVPAGDAAAQLGVDPDRGLDGTEVEERLSKYGPNELPKEPPPSRWVVARGQLTNPMNIMLMIVAVLSFVVGQIPTGIFVLGLVTFNVVMASSQELKARASVEALAHLQVPHARVRRGGAVEEVESTQLVPGDVVLLEAGDVVPADGRIVTSATLELQESALTGESAPVAKDGTSVLDAGTALGDRTNLVFQNTQVTRGTATVAVTATGSSTEMGRIANMVTSTQRQRSPLQKELDGMTKIFGSVAWVVVVLIAIVGILRGQAFDTVALLCISTAIASIPVGLPTFVQAMLSSGAQRLAASKAVVKSLADVETLGGTTVINSDKTGTLTLNQMTATTMLAGGDWFDVEGGGYRKSGAILGVAGSEVPDFRRLALGLTLCSDATVADDESIIGDPTEAALVVLAAKMSTDAEHTRNSLARRAEVPFDSEYKFMATFHDRPDWLAGGMLKERHFMTVKGAPDVVAGAVQPRPLAQPGDPDRRGPQGDTRRQPAAIREGATRPRVRCARPRRPKHVSRDRGSDGGRARSHLRRAGRDHRPPPHRGGRRRPHRAARRDRRAHDHRRPHGHRPGDRRRARPWARGHDRVRAPASPRRGSGAPTPQPARVRPRRARGQAATGQD